MSNDSARDGGDVVERITETMTFHFDTPEQQRSFHERLNDPNDWKHIAKHGLAKCTPEHTWAEWLDEHKAEITALRSENERLRDLLQRALKVADSGNWRDRAELSVRAHIVFDDIAAALSKASAQEDGHGG